MMEQQRRRKSDHRSSTSTIRPLKSVESIHAEKFGDAETRKTEDSLVLKKGVPSQPILRLESEYVMQQGTRIANGYKDLRKSFEDLLKELLLLQSQYQFYLAAFVELSEKLEHDRLLALQQLNESEAMRTQAIVEAVKVKNQKKDLEHSFKHSQELEGQSQEAKRKLELALERLRETETRLSSAELVAQAQLHQVQQKQEEIATLKVKIQEQKRKELQALEDLRIQEVEQLAQKRLMLESQQAQLGEKTQELESLKQQLSLAKMDHTRKANQIDLLEQRAQTATNNLNTKDANVQTALQTLNKSQENNEQRLAFLKQEITQLEAKCFSSVNEANRIQHEVEESAAVLLKLEHKLEALKAQEMEAKQRNVDFENSNGLLSAKLIQLRAEFKLKEAKAEDAKQERLISLQNLAEEKSQVQELLVVLETSKKREQKLQHELDFSNNALQLLLAPPPPPPSLESIASTLIVQEEENEKQREERENKRIVFELEKELAQLRQQVELAEAKRRDLSNQVQTLKGNMRVLVRVHRKHESAENQNILQCSLDGVNMTVSSLHKFSFNRIFDGFTSQLDVFQEVSSFLQSALDGSTVGVFVGGQMGKSFTLFGDEEHRGILPRALELLLGQSTHPVSVLGSFWEVSSEKDVARDLLGGEVAIKNLVDLLERVEKATNSKSKNHFVFTLMVKSGDFNGRIVFCELHGISSLVSTDMGIMELQKLLFRMTSTISRTKLCDLLYPCLQEEGKALLFMNVSASREDEVQTLESLRFAQKIQNTEQQQSTKLKTKKVRS